MSDKPEGNIHVSFRSSKHHMWRACGINKLAKSKFLQIIRNPKVHRTFSKQVKATRHGQKATGQQMILRKSEDRR